MNMQDSSVLENDLHFIRVATPQLKTMVAHYRTILPSHQFYEFLADIRKEFENYTLILGKYHPGADRARATHELIKQKLENNQIEPTCSKGCGFCCHLEVEITQDEAILLAKIVHDGHEIDRKKLSIQASRERKSPEWTPYLQESNRCVFLGKENSCQVYADRPSICRKHVVASDPKECMSASGKPQPILIPLAEIVLSAALSQPGNSFTSLSKGVLAALKEFPELAPNTQALQPENFKFL